MDITLFQLEAENESSLNSKLDDLIEEVGVPAEEGKDATGLFAEVAKKADAATTFTKDEVRSEIAASIAGADHLRRKKLGSYSE